MNFVLGLRCANPTPPKTYGLIAVRLVRSMRAPPNEYHAGTRTVPTAVRSVAARAVRVSFRLAAIEDDSVSRIRPTLPNRTTRGATRIPISPLALPVVV